MSLNCKSIIRFLLSFVMVLMGVANADGQSFDGITIIEFADSDGHAAIASGSHIVTFVSSRGSYGAVVSDRKGGHEGCQSLAEPGSYSGSSITFGMAADKRARKQGLRTYCPSFTLRFEDASTVRVEAGNRYSQRQKVIAHIPLRAIDFGAAHFTRHDLKGVVLGPVLNDEELGPLSRGGVSDKYKNFNRKVGQRGPYPNNVMGRAAAAEIMGWPWDVLFNARLIEKFEQKSTFESFKRVVLKRYGKPGSVYEKSDYMYALWMYDLDGRQITLDEPATNSCRATAEFSMKYDVRGWATEFDWGPNSNDLGPWGCSVVMDLRFKSGDGGVDGYSAMIMSGYAKAMNHFFQRIEQVHQMREKVREVQAFQPKL